MYLLFTTPGCSKCSKARQKLEERGVEYQEIDVTASEENMQLAEKYGVMYGGTVVDTETETTIIEL